MKNISVGKINPFLAAHYGLIPKGKVLFLGVGDGTDIVHFAANGYAVCVFEHDESAIEHAKALAVAAGVTAKWHHQALSRWRLGFEKWDGIVATFPKWPADERRRLMSAVPNALRPDGSLLFEGYAEGPCGPSSLDDDELDPDDFRAELDVLYLARFATVSRPIRQTAGHPVMTWVLQVVGTHLAVDGVELDGEYSEYGTSNSMAASARTGKSLVA